MWPIVTQPRFSGRNVLGDIGELMTLCLAIPFALWGLLPTDVLEDLSVVLYNRQDEFPTHRVQMGWEDEDGNWTAPPQPPPEGWFTISSRETKVLDRPSWLNIRQHLGIIYAAEFWGTVYCGPRSDGTGLFYDLKTCADLDLCPRSAVFAFGPHRDMVLPKLWTKEPYEQW
jgi:hypothetical protein